MGGKEMAQYIHQHLSKIPLLGPLYVRMVHNAVEAEHFIQRKEGEVQHMVGQHIHVPSRRSIKEHKKTATHSELELKGLTGLKERLEASSSHKILPGIIEKNRKTS